MFILTVILTITTIAATVVAVSLYSRQQKVLDDAKSLRGKRALEEANKSVRKKIQRAKSIAGSIEAKAKKKSREILSEAIKKRKEAEAFNDKINKRGSDLDKKLEEVAGLTKTEAKKKLVERADADVDEYIAQKIETSKKKTKDAIDEKVKELLIDAMQSVATDYVDDATTSTIKLKDEDVKGKIIGKEGRNIRALEKRTGVDFILDEGPDIVVLSSFDSVRREIARLAVEMLLKDGRIHPGTIEKYTSRAEKEIKKEIEKAGRQLAERVGWHSIPKELIPLIGRYKYRTSYGQSLFKHTLEVISIAEKLAAELGADVELVKKAGVLHDIGKVLTHKINRPHALLGGEVLRKYKLPDEIVNAVEAHHDEVDRESIEAEIIYCADAISGARPGARRESYESYLNRVEELEDTVKDVLKDKAAEVYAIHAGREIRVVVKPDEVSDKQAEALAFKASKAIKEKGRYPGSVVVTVIRETRATAVAE